jgi:hypothetical protein
MRFPFLRCVSALAAAAALLLVPGTARAQVVINFDELAPGTAVTSLYPEVTFTSEPGFTVRTLGAAFNTSPPTGILPFGNLGGGGADRELILDFANPVRALSFYASAVESSGTAAQVDVFVNGVISATENITGLGQFLTPVLVDLSAYSDVTRVRVYNITDPNGINYDDFSFTVAPAQAVVPEPGTLALLLAGTLTTGAGFLRRRA